MFTVSDCLLISKADTADVFDFDIERCRRNIATLRDMNEVDIMPVSAVTGEGMDEWVRYLTNKVRNC